MWGWGLWLAVCGPAGKQQAERILSAAAETAAANITIVPADTPQPTLDVNLIVKQTITALTAQAASQKIAATQAAPTSNSTTGSLSGILNYPSSSIPAMHIVAFKFGTESYKYVTTTPGQNNYKIVGLDPGTYWVVAYTIGGGGFPDGLAGGYK